MGEGAAAPGEALDPALRERVRALARRLPKVELHVHLEGTIGEDRLRQLARKHGVDLDPAATQRVQRGSSFAGFIAAFVQRLNVLRDPDDWCAVVDDLLRAQSAQNAPYTEAFVTFFGALRGDYVLADVLRAIADVEQDWHNRGCALRLIADSPRQFGEDMAMQLFRLAAADPTGLCIGVGIGGDELVEPAGNFARAYAFARDAGLRRTAHAGEHGGPESVRAAVDVLGAERIGHGVAAGNHPELLGHLHARGVAVDVCPGSNLATSAWDPARGPHPVRRFVEHGVRIDVGSDDPAIFGTNLSEEWAELMLRDGFSPHECFDLSLDSLQAAFLDDSHRARLRAHFDAELEDLREDAFALEEAMQAAGAP
ncbi:MAG TPA: adenosine deaminase [Candidatus Dormibacteraeota bacterium]|nr:adenosine deaminase [Candidatus Dormibacteraeota bacterium]